MTELISPRTWRAKCGDVQLQEIEDSQRYLESVPHHAASKCIVALVGLLDRDALPMNWRDALTADELATQRALERALTTASGSTVAVLTCLLDLRVRYHTTEPVAGLMRPRAYP